MIEMIRCYHVWIPKRPAIVRWILYCLYPVLVVAGYLVFFGGEVSGVYGLGLGIPILTIEMLMDRVSFCGSERPHVLAMEYILASARGLAVIRLGVLADCIRRFLSILVIYAAVFAWALVRNAEGISVVTFAGVLCMVYGIGSAFHMIARFVESLSVWTLVLYAMLFVYMAACFVYVRWEMQLSVFATVLLAILAVLLAACQVFVMVRQIRKNYYD